MGWGGLVYSLSLPDKEGGIGGEEIVCREFSLRSNK